MPAGWGRSFAADEFVCQSGRGRRRDPFRNWFPEKEAGFRGGMYNQLIEDEEAMVKRLRKEIEQLSHWREKNS